MNEERGGWEGERRAEEGRWSKGQEQLSGVATWNGRCFFGASKILSSAKVLKGMKKKVKNEKNRKNE